MILWASLMWFFDRQVPSQNVSRFDRVLTWRFMSRPPYACRAWHSCFLSRRTGTDNRSCVASSDGWCDWCAWGNLMLPLQYEGVWKKALMTHMWLYLHTRTCICLLYTTISIRPISKLVHICIHIYVYIYIHLFISLLLSLTTNEYFCTLPAICS